MTLSSSSPRKLEEGSTLPSGWVRIETNDKTIMGTSGFDRGNGRLRIAGRGAIIPRKTGGNKITGNSMVAA